MGGGLDTSSAGLKETSRQLGQIAEGVKGNPEIYKKLNMFAENIGK